MWVSPTNTTGPYGISNVIALESMGKQLENCKQLAYAANTLKGERIHWEYWVRFTLHMGTRTIRDNIAANSGIDIEGFYTECQLLQFAMLWIGQNCMAGRKTANGVTVPDPLPSSVLAVLHDVARIHKRKGIQMAKVDLKSVHDGLCRQYKSKWGIDALQPRSHGAVGFRQTQEG